MSTISCPLFSTLSIASVSHTMSVHSEQIVLPIEAYLLLGPDNSSEMDSETDDQSYSPTEVYALTWHGHTAHIMHTVSCIA